MNILLIEDDPADIEFVKLILSNDNIDVLNFPPKVLNEEYDLIIIDYFFKGTTSLEFLKSLGKYNTETAVLITSGKIDEVELQEIPDSLNALVLSKNHNFKNLLTYYKRLLCPSEDGKTIDYKTLLMGLVHDLRNDLMWCSYLRDFDKDSSFDMDTLKEKVLDSSVFAFGRLEQMSNYIESGSEDYSDIRTAFNQIKNSDLIKENIESVKFIGQTDKEIKSISTYLLSVILKNLIENSCKYKCPDKKLEVCVEVIESDDYLNLSVKDNSKGMTESKSDKVFNEACDSTSGLGIGLVVLNRIINSVNGKIKVNSQVNIGTTIIISFPKLDS